MERIPINSLSVSFRFFLELTESQNIENVRKKIIFETISVPILKTEFFKMNSFHQSIAKGELNFDN